MKETQLKPDTSIEVKSNTDQEKKHNYIGSITLQPGQKLYGYNMQTSAFFEVDLRDEKNYVFGTNANNVRTKRLYVNPDVLYVPAINEKNAKRKILKKFGFQFNTKGTLHNVDMPVKVVKQFVEMDKEGNMREVEAPEEKVEATIKVMTKAEAIEAMKQGKKVTHEYFSKDEWMTMKGNTIILEDGVKCDPNEFWQYRQGEAFETGYYLYEN